MVSGWRVRTAWVRLGVAALGTQLAACSPVANMPYPPEWVSSNTLFTSFQERPKFLDPVSSYNLDETPWMFSIYEPPLRYNDMRRPYQL
jgi:hypothetical protein